jgi:hypothetical protein
MQYTPSLHDSGWFTVQMLDLQIAGGTIGTDKSVYNRGKGVIVDSGTTDTYMPAGCAAGFKARWKEVSTCYCCYYCCLVSCLTAALECLQCADAQRG